MRRPLWILGLTLFLVAGLAQLPALEDMSDLGTGVIEFEFVATSEKAREILATWGDAGADAARTHLWLDYAFLLGYGLLLWLGATGVGAPRLALLGAAGAGLDAVENTALLVIVGGTTTQPLPALATLAASLKFAAIAVSLVGILALAARERLAGRRA